MITIPKKVEYSIVFLSYLAKEKDKSISLMEAAKKLFLPYRFLGHIAADLKLGGIVESKEGKSGGYKLAKDWQNKTMYDLIEILGENKHLVQCLDSKGGKCSRADKCQMRGLWNRIEESFVKELKEIKLKSI